ncbi:glycerol-3-phosphate ABC transporter ATP-binding protein [Leptolyngbya sp. BL0902]|uniref:ABC transporter ATP-binding protein n=1 Tax=Leptolyngbya sp. BL0902 TaxID=1115757 RepID=UPI0018E719D4|nr:ABC transporter ATP-binding protein [Leptolyngbya sp. BL0902]QQE66113.1 glycerol-3-phosphate ABC transporter ATP-binding protein [Leptolyngbya sp. BL0902]
MASVRFESVTKRYGDGVALRELDMTVNDGEFLVFVGPSGCGKTTTLRLLAGLETATSGHLYIGDRSVDTLPSKDRDIAMVFQSYALYPHMTVAENMAFSLELQGLSRGEIQQRVQRAAQQMGLETLLQRKPKELSGGQRQRVAVCRAIVRNPAVFLMDEPLSNLDAQLRGQARAEISQLHRDLGTTVIYVTHDQVEAMTMGTRIAVLNQGVLQQVDTPQAIYSTPKNKFVAGFMGSPAMNFAEGVLINRDDQIWFQSSALTLPLPPLQSPTPYQRYLGQRVIGGLRPEDLHDPRFCPADIPTSPLRGTIHHRESLGNEVILYLTLADGQTLMARVDRRSEMALGDTVELLANTAALHWFDPQTEEAI